MGDVDVDTVDTSKEVKTADDDKKMADTISWSVGDRCEGHFEDWWYEAKIIEISGSKIKVKFDIDDSEVLLDEAKLRKKGEKQKNKEEKSDDKGNEDKKPSWSVGDTCEGHFENWWYEAKIIEITE